jgi:hypothetical protein
MNSSNSTTPPVVRRAASIGIFLQIAARNIIPVDFPVAFH